MEDNLFLQKQTGGTYKNIPLECKLYPDWNLSVTCSFQNWDKSYSSFFIKLDDKTLNNLLWNEYEVVNIVRKK